MMTSLPSPVVASRGSSLAATLRHLCSGSPRAQRIIVVGCNRRTRRRLAELAGRRDRLVEVVGWLDLPAEGRPAAGAETLPFPHLGSVSRIGEVLAAQAVDEVLVTLPLKSCYDHIQQILGLCEEAGVPVSIGTDIFQSSIAHPNPAGAGDPERIVYTCVPHPRWKLRAKRAMDVAGALVALTLCAVPMALIALAIKLTSRGPVFFRQERVGLHRRPFRIVKFRTMVVDAERRLAELAHLNEQQGPVFKIRRDPRITPVGRLLRKLSLDELPQFFNVLAGDMSLVGPRPPIPAEVEQYEWWQRRRLSMKPGITCFWQVSGRNDVPFEEWMQLDLRYIDQWSLGLDVKLCLRTVPAVLLGRGAS